MAIADIVQYDNPVAVEILHPTTRKPIGLTIDVLHMDSDAALEAGQDANAKALAERLSGETTAHRDRELDILVACVAGWDWGGQEFEDGGGVLDATPENIRQVLSKAKWIRLQVAQKAGDIANFTKASKKN